MSDATQVSGRYTIERELARGGMGAVYEAVDNATGRRIALKRLLKEASKNPNAVRLFQREYHTLVQLQHPRIIEVYDYGVDDDGAFYTMELLDGKDLRELAPLGYREACRYLRDVASSLALLHARRMVHRDLSARNVRLTSEGRAKLLDFGALASFGVTGQIVGTPPVVPPEALGGHPLDQRSDLYALGALTYWLLTGRHAYPATRMQMLPNLWKNGPPRPPSTLVEGLPPELDELVMSLIDMDPMSRPSSAAAVIERLNVIGGLDDEPLVDVSSSYLSNPRIVGRERELQRVQRFVSRVVSHHATSLLIEGDAGVGKTRLVEEGTIGAQLGGATVIRVDAEVERGPYAALRRVALELLAALPDVAVEAAEPFAGTLSRFVPELREHYRETEEGKVGALPGEMRTAVQGAFADWFRAIAKRKPLVIAIDNAHAADEASLALCASLSRRATKTAVGMLMTWRHGEEGSAEHVKAALKEGAATISLVGLGLEDTTALVRALFGDVDHAGRLGKWLRDRTDGNPMQCLALARELIERGHIRYKDGAWVLPTELSDDNLPSGMQQLLERKVAGLGAGARELAEALSVQEGALSLEQCAALSGRPPDELFGAFAELVQKDLLANVGDDYRFTQSAFRRHLLDGLVPRRRRELHKRAGEYLLSRPDADAFVRIDAGWHLLRGGEESRGAEILAEYGGKLVQNVEGIEIAAPGLEAALEVFERQGRSDWAILNVLDALVSAGWYVDWRYAEKYGERAMDLALKKTGLALATRVAPVLGPKLALALGLTVAGVKHGFAKKRIEVRRFRKFEGVFHPVVNCIAVLIGVAANRFDAPSTDRVLERIKILRCFPADHTLRLIYDYASHYRYASNGFYNKAIKIGESVVKRLETRLDQEGSAALLGGQMTGLAFFSAVAGTERALYWANRLEDLGFQFYRVMAGQARFIYHAHRGELGKAAPYLQQLELNAIEGGTTWQTSLLVPYMLGGVHTATGEVVQLRAVAEALEARAREMPIMAPVSKFIRAAYHYWRGRPAQATQLLDELTDAFAPGAHSLWPGVHALHVRALLAEGRKDEALALARRASEQVPPEDRDASLVHRELDLSRALAEAECGHADSAAATLDERIEISARTRVPLALALLHETRATVALHQSDREAFCEHAEQMGTWARATDNAALVAKWKRLETQGRRQLDDQTDVPGALGPTVSAYASAVRVVLSQHQGESRIRMALRMLIEQSNATRGYLYLGAPPRLTLAAQFPEDVPPSVDLSEHLCGLAAAVHASTEFLDAGDATGTMAVTHTGGPVEADTYPADMSAQLLVVPHNGQPKVVGAVALELDRDASAPPGYDLLEAVAESLRDPSGPVTTERGAKAASETGSSAQAASLH